LVGIVRVQVCTNVSGQAATPIMMVGKTTGSTETLECIY